MISQFLLYKWDSSRVHKYDCFIYLFFSSIYLYEEMKVVAYLKRIFDAFFYISKILGSFSAF